MRQVDKWEFALLIAAVVIVLAIVVVFLWAHPETL